MIAITRENAEQVSQLSASSLNPEASRSKNETSPLIARIKSAKKSDGYLFKQGGVSSRTIAGRRLLNTLKRALRWSADEADNEDIELSAVIYAGEKLYQQAEDLRDARGEMNQQQILPLSLKSKTACVMGAAIMLAGAGLWRRQYSHSRYNPASTAMANTSETADLFSTPFNGEIKAARHVRRHLALPQPVSTVLPGSGVSQKKLFDFACQKEREALSFSDVLRNIAKTLHSPIKMAGEEWQIVYDYEYLKKGCPKTSEKTFLLNIMHYIDTISSTVLHSFPGFVPLTILQNLVPPVLESIADRLEGKAMDFNLIIEINSEFLSVSQMLSASLDLHSVRLLSKEHQGPLKDIIPDKLNIKKGGVFVEVNGGEFKMNRDSDGVSVYNLEQKSLLLKKQYISYSRDNKSWVNGRKTIVMSPDKTGRESVFEAGRRLLTYARNELIKIDKEISSVDFVTRILAKSGLAEEKNMNLFLSSATDLSSCLKNMENTINVAELNQLLKVKTGQVIVFIEDAGKNSPLKHTMLAMGNGLFSGVNNEILAAEFVHDGITLTAEQLGNFEDGVLISSEGKKFKVYAGSIKDTKLPFDKSYKESVLQLEKDDYSAGGAHAIGVVLSRTGDIPPELVTVMREDILNKGPIRSYITAEKLWLKSEEIDENTPPGGIIFLTRQPTGSYEGGIFALRLNNDEYFIPELFEPSLKISGQHTIYKSSDLKNQIKERNLWAKSVSFNLKNTRIQALLGKDARFYSFGAFLRVRAHGGPRNINYKSPSEIVSIIKGLAKFKGIDLDKINSIEIESCFGATGFPSSGRIISASMGKRVVAWRGKYRTTYDAEPEARVIYDPTPLSDLESVSAEVTDRNINFINKVRGIYHYLVNTVKESSAPAPPRTKRNSRYFNLFLIEIGRLVLGKLDIDTFIKNNELFYGQHDSYSTIIRELLLSYSVKDDLAFFELCMEVLYISPEATDYLDAYLSKPLDEEYYSLAMQSSPAVVSRSETGFNKIVTLPALMDIAYNLGISTENMYLSPKSWNEFGFQGDIFLNKKGNKFFEYRKEGHPSTHFWHYPDDASDNENWLYAGRHPGTMEQPKHWYEYGKAGSIYYDVNYGYLILKTDGRPSDHQWYFPPAGQSGQRWEFVTRQAGTFTTPLAWNDKGAAGNVYYSEENESFYVLKKMGSPTDHGWRYPTEKKDDENWIYAGKNLGTLDSPKQWQEYGKAGSVYFQVGWGYMSLVTEGSPSENYWVYPNAGNSNAFWSFICYEVGSFKSPKLPEVEGTSGEVYYSVDNQAFYILRKDGKPARQGWSFPAGKTDDGNWIYAGENPGTPDLPKAWTEYGKPGSLYYHPGYGYFSLKTEGRPSDNNWPFPEGGNSSQRWKLISWERGSFNAPKSHNDPGSAGDVYYSDENQTFYILKANGNPSLYGWFFPSNEQDNENWIYAGRHKGTLDSPKTWDEYGRAGSLYLQPGYGYLALNTEGRPSSSHWQFPDGGKSNRHWKFVSWDVGTFDTPKKQNVQGKTGEVYFSDESASFYILKNNKMPLTKNWHFPAANMDNKNWFYAGKNRGTLDSPKLWSEYGKAGSVYYDPQLGYFTLKSEGRPPDEKWLFPPIGTSNQRWQFISREAGTFNAPKRPTAEGVAGELYYSDEHQLFYLLRNAGNPSRNGWDFPPGRADNENWICAGQNRGTPESPKAWNEYGKVGSVYYHAGYGYLTLKTSGRPSQQLWSFPQNGTSNSHWNVISWIMGSFKNPKNYNVKGTVGEVYYDDKNQYLYILKSEGTPADNGWQFPSGKADNANWLYSGEHHGTLESPKAWHEYGKTGSVYHSFKYGYLILQTEGRPSDKKWYYPPEGQSDYRWKFISWEAGSFTAPKRLTDEGIADEVYYSDEDRSFYILRKSGNPANRGWHLPVDESDDANWVYAGKNNGTLHSPKEWEEYGKTGSVYYQTGHGFLILKTAGRPADNQWSFPARGNSNRHWKFISFKAGAYTAPKQPNEAGVVGEVYYCSDNRLFYILRKEGTPSLNGWRFPDGKMDNWNWLYGGLNMGTKANPKIWEEYGKVGSVYYKSGYGHHILQTEGNPSTHKWYFPPQGESNAHWQATN
ncbi:glucosyltransferase [Erwinia amylovora]|uniref:glucosyltransferase n=1 Tax=Erwinia amylovora TaxID=552 RepID=UPI000C07C11E|nr:glucosyltransferase [Erwinia amylovora]